jgi:hypothetical protein
VSEKKKIINAKNKNDLMAQIANINTKDTEVYLSLRPTMQIVHRIMDQSPNMMKISCPPSLYLQVSKKVFKYTQTKNITLTSGDFKVGRPMVHDPETIKQIISKRASGVPAKVISQEFEVPLRTVYFYLKNGVQE